MPCRSRYIKKQGDRHEHNQSDCLLAKGILVAKCGKQAGQGIDNGMPNAR